MDQKKQLIDVVLELFQEQGASFKMDDVASRMRISKKTIYKEYGNKETLIILVVKAIFQGIEHQLAKIMEDDTYNTMERLIHVCCAFPDVDEIDFHKALALKVDFPDAYTMFISYIEDNWTLTEKLFNQSIEEGFIRQVPFAHFKTVLLGIMKQVLEQVDDPHQEVTLETCVRMVFEGLAK